MEGSSTTDMRASTFRRMVRRTRRTGRAYGRAAWTQPAAPHSSARGVGIFGFERARALVEIGFGRVQLAQHDVEVVVSIAMRSGPRGPHLQFGAGAARDHHAGERADP